MILCLIVLKLVFICIEGNRHLSVNNEGKNLGSVNRLPHSYSVYLQSLREEASPASQDSESGSLTENLTIALPGTQFGREAYKPLAAKLSKATSALAPPKQSSKLNKSQKLLRSKPKKKMKVIRIVSNGHYIPEEVSGIMLPLSNGTEEVFVPEEILLETEVLQAEASEIRPLFSHPPSDEASLERHLRGVPYKFGWIVDDEETSNYQTRQEEGDTEGKVIGCYQVLDPTGLVRTVRYKADESGFHITRFSRGPDKTPCEGFPEEIVLSALHLGGRHQQKNLQSSQQSFLQNSDLSKESSSSRNRESFHSKIQKEQASHFSTASQAKDFRSSSAHNSQASKTRSQSQHSSSAASSNFQSASSSLHSRDPHSFQKSKSENLFNLNNNEQANSLREIATLSSNENFDSTNPHLSHKNFASSGKELNAESQQLSSHNFNKQSGHAFEKSREAASQFSESQSFELQKSRDETSHSSAHKQFESLSREQWMSEYLQDITEQLFNSFANSSVYSTYFKNNKDFGGFPFVLIPVTTYIDLQRKGAIDGSIRTFGAFIHPMTQQRSGKSLLTTQRRPNDDVQKVTHVKTTVFNTTDTRRKQIKESKSGIKETKNIIQQFKGGTSPQHSNQMSGTFHTSNLATHQEQNTASGTQTHAQFQRLADISTHSTKAPLHKNTQLLNKSSSAYNPPETHATLPTKGLEILQPSSSSNILQINTNPSLIAAPTNSRQLGYYSSSSSKENNAYSENKSEEKLSSLNSENSYNVGKNILSSGYSVNIKSSSHSINNSSQSHSNNFESQFNANHPYGNASTNTPSHLRKTKVGVNYIQNTPSNIPTAPSSSGPSTNHALSSHVHSQAKTTNSFAKSSTMNTVHSSNFFQTSSPVASSIHSDYNTQKDEKFPNDMYGKSASAIPQRTGVMSNTEPRSTSYQVNNLHFGDSASFLTPTISKNAFSQQAKRDIHRHGGLQNAAVGNVHSFLYPPVGLQKMAFRSHFVGQPNQTASQVKTTSPSALHFAGLQNQHFHSSHNLDSHQRNFRHFVAPKVEEYRMQGWTPLSPMHVFRNYRLLGPLGTHKHTSRLRKRLDSSHPPNFKQHQQQHRNSIPPAVTFSELKLDLKNLEIPRSSQVKRRKGLSWIGAPPPSAK